MSDPRAHGNGPGYEHRDVSIRVVSLAGIALGLVTIAFATLSWVLFQFWVGREAASSAPRHERAALSAPVAPPEPRLQPRPIEDLVTLRSRERAELETYGWIDREAGVVRVPIARAMEMLTQRGLPTRSPKEVPK